MPAVMTAEELKEYDGTLIPALDLGDALAAHGLGHLALLFRAYDFGFPFLQLCVDHGEVWDEVFATALSPLAQEERERLVLLAPAVVAHWLYRNAACVP